MGLLGLLDTLALQDHLDREESLVFRDFQVTRVIQALQDPLESQEMMEQEDLKETKVTLPVSVVYLVQRVSQVALDTKDVLEPLERKAFLEMKGPEGHQADLDSLVLLDHQGVQVILGCPDSRVIQEKWETPGQEVMQEI